MTLESLVANFSYRKDRKWDTWRILKEDDLKGDCDDFAVTALYRLSEGSLRKFWWNLISGKAKFLFCHVGPPEAPEGHVVLWYDGRCIDNIVKRWKTKEQLESYGYDFHSWAYIWPHVAFKMFLGKVLG